MTPMTQIEVGGLRRIVALEAVVDTGFEGEICVPLDVAVTLSLELVGVRLVELADGSRKRELLFRGFAVLKGTKQDVGMFVVDGEEALLGTDLLHSYRLVVDFPRNKVSLSSGRARR